MGYPSRETAVQVTMTGERVTELETCADIMREGGMTGKLSRQRILSCAMQVMIAFKQSGGVITYEFSDKRLLEA